MTEISLELVPRNELSLRKELEQVRRHLPVVNRINIPDILRFDMRSWQGCAIAGEYVPHTIPHLRAIDFNPDAPLPILEQLRDSKVEAVLIINGDPPQEMKHTYYRTSSLEMIRRLKRECPELTIYAGIDPYRSGIKDEIDYMHAKQDAGADGFFTQPFFDLRLMEIYQGFFRDTTIYWGVSPVLTDSSRSYWENKNHAIFPRDFAATLDWNRDFARKTLEFARRYDDNVYFMPIKTDIVQYLQGII